MLPKISLKQMAVFASVYETGSTVDASDVLNLSQSAVSSALTAFEERLNLPLFERVGRRLEPHPYTQQIYIQVQAVLGQALSIEHYRKHQAGQMRIGASTTIGNYVLPEVIATMQQQLPDADIELHIANTQEVVAEVEQLRVDIALVEATPHPSNFKVLTQKRWRNDKLMVFARRDSRWLTPYVTALNQANKTSLGKSYQLTTTELARLPMIVRETGSGTRQSIDELLLQYLPDVQVVMEIAQSEAIKRMVMADIGVGCLSQHVIEHELASGELVVVEVAGLDLSRQWWMVWHTACHQSALWQHFVAMF